MIRVERDHQGTDIICPQCGHPLQLSDQTLSTYESVSGPSTRSAINGSAIDANSTLPPESFSAGSRLAGQALLDTATPSGDSTGTGTDASGGQSASWATIAPDAPRGGRSGSAVGGSGENTKTGVPVRADENSTVATDMSELSSIEAPLYAPLEDPDLPVRVARFLVRSRIGEGSFGRVYRAYDEHLDREVAVKVAKSETLDSPKRVRRFLQEARTAAQLQHPHIVPVFDAGKDGNQYYIAAAFIAGKDLEGTLEAGRMDARRSAEVVRSLAHALAYAHGQAKPIVHRDVKPANVMMDAKGQPMLMDFGLAARDDGEEKLTHDGAIMGTPMYMSPEQAAGRTAEIGPASDQYSLGVVLYEMLCGRPPFRGSVRQIMAAHQETEPPAPSSHDPSVPKDLETICLKTLAKTPKERYATCNELAEDLRRFLADEPILARQAGLIEKVTKWARRKPGQAKLVVGLAAACVLVLIAGFGLALLWGQNEKQIRIIADRERDIAQTELEKIAAQKKAREQSSNALVTAKEHKAIKDYTAAEAVLAAALEALDNQPDLEAEDLRVQLVRLRDAVIRERQASERLRVLDGHYSRALEFLTGFTSLDEAANQAKILDAARQGLAIYPLYEVKGGDTVPLLEQDRSSLTAPEFVRLTESYYDLLLLWAVAESTPPPGKDEPPDQARKRAERTLDRLNRVARFGKAYGFESLALERRMALATEKPPPAGEPRGALDWFHEALERYRKGNYAEASSACDRVLRVREDHFWARYVRGLCHIQDKRWGEAKSDLTICLTGREDSSWPRLLRGIAETELGNEYAKKDLKAWATTEFKAALEDFDAVLSKKDLDQLMRYVALTQRGVLNFRRKNSKEALADLGSAIKVNRERVEAYSNLAQVLQDLKRLDEALKALDDAIRVARRERSDLYESRANLYRLRKEWAKARADIEKAIELEPRARKPDRLIDILVLLGIELNKERQYAEAMVAFDRALKLRPDYVKTQRYRAEALLALKRTDEAAKALDSYLDKTKNPRPAVYQARGLIHAAANQLPGAIDMYSAALRLDLKDNKTRGLRGWTYLETGALKLALADFEEWIRLAPTSAEALIGRGSARIRMGKLKDAVEDAAKAEKQGALSDRLLFHLARLYALAAAQAETEARAGRPAKNLPGASQSAQYEEKALQYLRWSLQKMPPEKRSAFWREQVLTDPTLMALRRGNAFQQMAKQYGQLRS